jgi:heme/copper-type cytochrome/quinol oxidase subunit 4
MGVKLLLEWFVFIFAFIDITIQLLFFLLYSSVIDLLEISLLS